MRARRFVILGVAAVLLLSGLALGLLSQRPGLADSALVQTEPATYIVLGHEPALAASAGVIGFSAADPSVTGVRRLDTLAATSRSYLDHLTIQQARLLANIESALGRAVEVRYQYQAAINGFALTLKPDEADRVARLPGVLHVVRDFPRHLLTDNGPAWIGAPAIWDEAGGGTKGEGIVIGVIDTGINTDHPSFADIGGDGFDHTNPRGRFFGNCDPLTGLPFCNDKLIGVYDFTGAPPLTGEDDNGHGSHTASTAAGNVLDLTINTPTLTINRRISGVAPHANIIAYRACQSITPTVGLGGCLLSALLASINQATLDGVDVINFSIGGGSSDPWTDLDALAFLNARRAGVFVSASAGNAGPGPRTVGSPSDAPWVLSVGASTHNRKLSNALVDLAGGVSAPPSDMEGKSLTSGYGPARIVYAGDYGAPLCGAGPANPATGEGTSNPFPPGTFNGEIVVCDRGTYGRVHKGANVKAAGAGGYVLANDALNGASLVGDPYPLPGVHVTHADGVVLKAWLASGTDHTGRIRGTVLDESPANGDVMGSFSSRGPNPAVPDVIKPDVTATGVDILAAFHDAAGPAPQWGIISGTSMSSPHAAGAAALVRALHPTWTPDEVKSALMTTSFTTAPGTGSEAHEVLKETGTTPADAFDMGAGRIDLRLAGQAGLVLDIDPDAYGDVNAPPADLRALNLASLADDACSGICSWTRVVKSTAAVSVLWNASALAPAGVALSVSPTGFTIAPGGTQAITITANVNAATPGQWYFGRIKIVPDSTTVPAAHLPVAVFAAGGVAPTRLTLHFHGNAAPFGEDHDSGHPGEGECTGDGRTDVFLCSGPFLLKSDTLSPSPAASWKGGPADWLLDGVDNGGDRTGLDPSWLWCLRTDDPSNPDEFECPETESPAHGEVTLEGPMTVEWWAQCALTCVLGTDWDVRLFADGIEVVERRVDAGAAPTGVPTLLRTTVEVPRVTANHRITLLLEPVFLIDQDMEFTISYDSTEPCSPMSSVPCDSLVHMPVVGLEPPNQAPDAVDDAATVDQGSAVDIDVLANDVDPDGDALSILSFTSGMHGTVAAVGGGLRYTHDGPGATSDSFTYTVSDGRGGADTATVAVTLLEPSDTLEGAIAELDDLIASDPGSPGSDKLEDIRDKLEAALAELRKSPPARQAAIGGIEGAVGDLDAAVDAGYLDPADGDRLMNRVTGSARQLAVDAIHEATVSNGERPGEIDEAERALAEGDALRADGSYKPAVNRYKDALGKAESV